MILPIGQCAKTHEDHANEEEEENKDGIDSEELVDLYIYIYPGFDRVPRILSSSNLKMYRFIMSRHKDKKPKDGISYDRVKDRDTNDVLSMSVLILNDRGLFIRWMEHNSTDRRSQTS
jgi:hypothetical protein